MSLYFIAFIVAQFLFSVKVSSDEATTQPSLEALQKMPIKQLKAMLSSKGLDCVGCTEKTEYVTKAFESLSLPPVNENTPKSGGSSEDITGEANKPEEKGKVDKIKKEELDDLMAQLKKGGFGNTKMFTADDLKNMSPDQMNDKFKGGKSSSKSKKESSSKKKDKKKSGSSSKDKKNKRSGSSSNSKNKKEDRDSNVPKSSSSKFNVHVEEEEGDTIEL